MTGAHGTDAGYQKHIRCGTPPCGGCREARNANQRRRRAAARLMRERQAEAERAYRASVAEWRAEHAESVLRKRIAEIAEAARDAGWY